MGTRYYIRIKERPSGKLIHEYDHTFGSTDEIIEDVYNMITGGFIEYNVQGHLIEIYDIHPDVPGAVPLKTEKI